MDKKPILFTFIKDIVEEVKVEGCATCAFRDAYCADIINLGFNMGCSIDTVFRMRYGKSKQDLDEGVNMIISMVKVHG